jgi:lipoprotein-anchoring transpeptidase ErfK/SrfK
MLPPAAAQINAAAFQPPSPSSTPAASSAAPAGDAVQPLLVRAQVLLDRAHVSPGSIDGRNGSNFAEALRAYQTAHGLPASGTLDGPAFAALVKADPAPVVQSYVITADDVRGPFIGALPNGFQAQAKLPSLGWLNPAQELAERFHMSPKLLQALNPGADFGQAGTQIVVTAPSSAPLAAEVARLEIDKTARAVRAYGADGALLAVFPASVGSEERPAPSGELKVLGVSRDPTYVYDPSKLTFGPKHAGKLTLKPGPNNPVGVVWIALSKATYGVHGSPDPDAVGKHQSHGCVRLTNWDAWTLGEAVKPGVTVDFVGTDSSARGQ